MYRETFLEHELLADQISASGVCPSSTTARLSCLSCLSFPDSLVVVSVALRWNPVVCGPDSDGFDPNAAHHWDVVHLQQLGVV